ncbi:hypothetical protein N7G274_003902 [Stereocaulon virgatum]|uniref:Uncharacterized protein n=1 Tax=Stereocaulon virgatum TaxID=373712 RepID=A0ABR4ACV6_9LECA
MASAILASGPQAAEFHLGHPNATSIPALDAETRADVGDFLVMSPYTSQPHLLDLRSYQEPQRLLARALTVLEPVRVDYATAQYDRSFNWNAVVDRLRFLSKRAGHAWTRQDFYIVVFRSQVIPTTDRVELGGLDQNSHAEANRSGGLLKYWFGMPDENGRNLATCIWRKREDAGPGSVGPGHRAAVKATVSMYSEWKIERLRFVIEDDVSSWYIQQWED